MLAIVFILLTYSRYMRLYGDEGLALAGAYASSVKSTISSLSQQVEAVTQNRSVVDEALAVSDRKAILADAAKTSTFKDFAIAYSTGKTYNDTDISDREYFKKPWRPRARTCQAPWCGRRTTPSRS